MTTKELEQELQSLHVMASALIQRIDHVKKMVATNKKKEIEQPMSKAIYKAAQEAVAARNARIKIG